MSVFWDYPEEIWEEIMIRLPPESLKQLKLVSKSCKALINRFINDPEFVAKHLRNMKSIRATAGNLYFRDLYTVSSPESRDGTYLLTLIDQDRDSCEYVPCLNDNNNSSVFESLSGRQQAGMFRIVSHCNGIICFHSCVNLGQDHIFLANPSNNELKAVHHPINYEENEFEALGFGYDPRSDDYKLVTVTNGESEPPTKIEVYSLSTDEWRQIDDTDVNYYFSLYDCYSAYANGACYWLLCDDGMSGVVSFDLSDEVFRHIPFPEEIERDLVVVERIVASDESLALFSYPGSDDFEISMWILGSDGCWTKRITVGPLPSVCYPTSFVGSDLLLLRTEDYGTVLSFDIRTQKVGDESRDLEHGSVTRLVSATKSLVSVLKYRK